MRIIMVKERWSVAVCCLVLLSFFETLDNVFGVPLRNSIWTNDTEMKSINVARLVDNLVKAVKIVEDEYGVVSVAKSPDKRWVWLSSWSLGTAQPTFHMLKRVNHSRVFREAVGFSRVGRSAQLISQVTNALNLVKIKNKIETWISAKSSCVTCKIIATLLQIVVKMGTSDVEITITIYSLCILLQTTSRKVCDGISTTFANDVLDVLKRVEMRPSEICSFMMMDEACAESNTIHEWNVPFPPIKKPPVKSPVPPLEGAPTIKVLQLSDTHYDPDYETGANAECNEPLCCRATNGPPATASAAAGAWGDYRKCDTPKRTIDHMLEHIAAEHPDIDYILWTGDLPPHDVWNQTRKKNVQIMRDTVAQMIETFPGVPIFPALGNHESSPVNSFPPPSASGENKMSWLYEELHKQWARLLPSDVPATVRYGAFYSLLVRPGLRILSVNTNYCNNLNFHLLLDSRDPAQELRWLIRELQVAESNGEKVHIIGHIPPGGSNCVKVWSGMYYKIINRYEATVAAQFFGHTHFDEYEVFYDTADLERALGIAYIGPSVTPYYNLNPGYRIYHVDGDHEKTTRLVVDHESWIMKLDDANRDGHPTWYKMYSARQAYKMPSLLPKDWDALIDKMTDDQATFDLYYKHYNKDSPLRPFCGNDCRKRLLCDLRSGRSQNRRTLCKRLEARIEGPTKDAPWRQWV